MTDQTNDQAVQEEAVEQQPVILSFQMSLDNVNNLLAFLSNANGAVNLLTSVGAATSNPIPLWIQIIRSQAVAQLQQMQEAAQAAQAGTEESAPTVQ